MRENKKVSIVFFFLSGFFFKNVHEPQDSKSRETAFFLTPHYHFHPLHRHLDMSQEVTAESSPLHMGSSRVPLVLEHKFLTTKLHAHNYVYTYFTNVTKVLNFWLLDKTQSFKNEGSCGLIKEHFGNRNFSFKPCL